MTASCLRLSGHLPRLRGCCECSCCWSTVKALAKTPDPCHPEQQLQRSDQERFHQYPQSTVHPESHHTRQQTWPYVASSHSLFFWRCLPPLQRVDVRRRSFVPNMCLLALPQLCMAATWSVAIILLSLRVVIDLLLPAVSFVDLQHRMCSSLPSATMTPAAPASLLSES